MPLLLRVVQIVCIVVTAVILWLIGRVLTGLSSWGGPGFSLGFIFGAFFVVIVYGFICWIDPASRPRGTRPEEHRFRDGLE